MTNAALPADPSAITPPLRTPGVEIARWVLADASVRSLTLGPATDMATVRYRGREKQHASLAWLARRFGADAALPVDRAAVRDTLNKEFQP